MDIKTFATEHRLKVTRDGEGEDIEHVILGRVGESLIYEYGGTELGVAFITSGKKPERTGLYNTFKEACLAVGMTIRQSGKAEGAFSFDPANPRHAKAAIKGIRARVRRKLSPEQAEACAARLAAVRLSQSLGQIHT